MEVPRAPVPETAAGGGAKGRGPPPPPPGPLPRQRGCPAPAGSADAATCRRNERERNRVKLVNLGFAELQRHVQRRGPGKRMSKVDTLRSAVDYIRGLELLLLRGGPGPGTPERSPNPGADRASLSDSPLSSSSSGDASRNSAYSEHELTAYRDLLGIE